MLNNMQRRKGRAQGTAWQVVMQDLIELGVIEVEGVKNASQLKEHLEKTAKPKGSNLMAQEKVIAFLDSLPDEEKPLFEEWFDRHHEHIVEGKSLEKMWNSNMLVVRAMELAGERRQLAPEARTVFAVNPAPADDSNVIPGDNLGVDK